LGPSGNRTNLAESLYYQQTTLNRTYAWGYDNAYRLTSENVSGTSPTGTLTYSYDDVGNRLSRTGTLGPLGRETLNFDNDDRISKNSNPSTYFDANGNTTSYGGTYQYDYANRLTNANSSAVQIFYGADGNRVKKVVGSST